MPDTICKVIHGILALSGAPAIETHASAGPLPYGIAYEENQLTPTHLDPVEVPCPMVGMVVSPDPLRWNWKESGREHTTAIGPSSLLTLPLGQVPEQWWRETVSILTVSFAPEQLTSAIGNTAALGISELRRRADETHPVVSHLLWALHACVHATHPQSPIVLESIGVALAAAAAQNLSDVPLAALDPGKGLDRICLHRLTDFVEGHLDGDLHLHDLARVAHMSQFHFSRCFKRTTGQTVHQFVLERRTAKARSLLAGTWLPLPEIAVRVGLPNHGHFTTVFRQQVGSTPGQFRRMFRR